VHRLSSCPRVTTKERRCKLVLEHFHVHARHAWPAAEQWS
jgi:hypothetical protein